MSLALSPTRIAQSLTELWSPRVIAELDDSYIKVAKVHGTFGWHAHAHEDEMFLVLSGLFSIALRDGQIELGPGELYVVPKGVEHNPSAAQPSCILLIEKKSTAHAGDSVNAYSRSIAEQLRQL
jgi:mannose-6-phosphate isomerase-like protein (cupin superfamily)